MEARIVEAAEGAVRRAEEDDYPPSLAADGDALQRQERCSLDAEVPPGRLLQAMGVVVDAGTAHVARSKFWTRARRAKHGHRGANLLLPSLLALGLCSRLA